MARDISVSIAVNGEKEFAQALRDAQSAVKVLDSELKASQAAYKNNGDAQQYLTNKQRLLNDQLEQQRIIAKKLADAVDDSAKEFGEATREADRYRIAYNNARETIEKMEKELKDTDREMEELGRDSIRVGRQLEQGIGDGAQEAARELDDMTDLLDSVKQLTTLSGIGVGIEVIGKAVDVMDGITGIIEGSEEFNRQMSYINQNAKEAGISTETVGKYLAFATSAIGEFDQAAEGMNNLMGAKLNAKELGDAMNLLIGAVIDLPETFTFPALAEGMRETLQQKQAVGQFADLLSYLNVDLDTFNKAMEKTGTLDAAQDVLLSFTANRGLEETLTGWAKENQDMIDAKTAAFDLNVQIGELAKTMQPLGTSWTEMKTAAVETITALLQNTGVDEWAADQLDRIAEIIRLLATAEGRTELLEKYVYGENYGKTYTEEDFEPEGIGDTEAERNISVIEQKIARQKSIIQELKMTGDSVQLMSAEWVLAELEAELEAAKQTGKNTAEATIEGMNSAIEGATPETERILGLFVDKWNTELARITVPDVAGSVYDQMNTIDTLINRRTVYAYGPTAGGSSAGGGADTPLTVNFSVGSERFWTANIDNINKAQGRTINIG